MPATVPWQPTETAAQVLRLLQAGECVALPTESTYEIVAPACCPEAVKRLDEAAHAEEPPDEQPAEHGRKGPRNAQVRRAPDGPAGSLERLPARDRGQRR